MKNVVSLLCFILSASLLSAQMPTAAEKQQAQKIGGYVGYQYNLHNAAFSQLPGVPSCCPKFNSGTGAGVSIGALYELPLSRVSSLLVRGGYSSIGATLKETQTIGNALQGDNVVSAEVEHYLETSLGILSLQPGIAYSPFDFPLSFHVGFEAGMLLTKNYKQREVLIRPDNAVFQDTKSGIRNESEGTIANTNSLRLAGFAGIGTEIPIGKNLTLAPALEYFYGLTNVLADSSWTASTVRLTTAIKFALIPAPEPAPPVEEPVKPQPKPEPEPVKPEPVLAATLTLQGISAEGARSAVESVVVEETELEEHFPVLFHVFFNENSSALSANALHLLSGSQTDDFSESKLQPEAMAIYREMLNIVGARMKNNPKMLITLTGATMDMGAEKGNLQLARARAEAVKQYLTEVWKVPSQRIAIKTRNLPAKASNNALPDGQEENRRVEITMDNSALMEPVRLKDVSRLVRPAAVEITPVITAESGLRNWSLNVRSGSTPLASFDGSSAQSVVWKVDPDKLGTEPSQISFELSVQDAAGKQKTATQVLPARTLSLQQKRYEIKDDKRYEKFSLILFGYNETELDEQHRVTLDNVKARLTPQSTITILGYTDRTGDPAYNRQLAERRCINVRNYLGNTLPASNVTIKAIGSDVQLFDNSTPQGRSYSRTVQIIVETPVQ